MNSADIQLIDFDKDFLDLSWSWLNDPEIRQLTSTPEISKAGQLAWFNSLPDRTDYKVWGICFKNEKIGVIGLKKITGADAEYFGYIGVKEYWGKGISTFLFRFILDYAAGAGLQKIWLTVAKENTRAIKAYEKAGFSTFNTDDLNNYMTLPVI